MRQIIYMFFRMSRAKRVLITEICNKEANQGNGQPCAVDNKGPKVG